MLFDLIDLLERTDAYVCVWRDGELFIEPVPTACSAATDNTVQTNNEVEDPIAA